MKNLAALIAGLVFGLGLIISGMSNPAKVLAFLDLSGEWDPSLLLVMLSGLAVTALGYRWAGQMSAPLFAGRFQIPTRRDIDWRLVFGAVIFGLGWGLAGLCPGPALTAVSLGGTGIIVFLVTMVLGSVMATFLSRALN